MIDKDTVTALGEQAKHLPFSAAIDQQGRLTTIEVEVPATSKSAAYRAQITYDHFNMKVSPQEPRPAVEATGYIYMIANAG